MKTNAKKLLQRQTSDRRETALLSRKALPSGSMHKRLVPEQVQGQLSKAYKSFAEAIQDLLNGEAVSLGEADPPSASGVYVLITEGTIRYVGEAKGSGGLRDRLLRKHASGDDNHAIQRALKVEYPDRLSRREYMRKNVYVKWVKIDDKEAVSVVERLLIWLIHPEWNQK